MRLFTAISMLLLFVLHTHGSEAHARPASKPRTVTHSVTSGDTLSGLAKHYGTTVKKIRTKNRLKTDRLRIGQTLKIRATRNFRSARKSSGKSTRKRARKGRSPRNPGECSYTVKKGDSLWKIAKRKKTSIKELRKWNGRKAKSLRPGRQLKVCHLKIGGGKQKQKNAVRLPAEGPGFEAPRRNRVWGQPHAIEAIQTAAKEVFMKFPGTHPLFIGDVSFKKGGYMPPHKSHRKGIDADISYFVLGNPEQGRFARATTKTLDPEKNWYFIEALLRTGQVHQFYVEHSLQKVLRQEAKRQGYSEEELKKLFEYPGRIGSGRRKMIRHIKGHDDHLHVRFTATRIERNEAKPPAEPVMPKTVEENPGTIPESSEP